MEHHYRYSGSDLHHDEGHRNAALSHALHMLDCNTKLMSSPLTKGFTWMTHSYFPFIAYIQILQYLKWRPMSPRSVEAWEAMNENYSALLEVLSVAEKFFTLLTNMILQAWEVCESSETQPGKPMEPPHLVSSILRSRELHIRHASNCGAGQAPSTSEAGNFYYSTHYDLDMDHLDWSAMNWDLRHTETTFGQEESSYDAETKS